jgi:signal transduction histidine kinase
LSHDQSVLSFEFAALGFRNPEKNRYAQKLGGFDRDWVESGSQRTATYTNLDPGEYVFEVKASNDSGVWNEKGTSIRVSIAPPFWGTWWFRGLSLLAIGSIVLTVHRLRTSFYRQRNRRLEMEIGERKKVEAELATANCALEAKNTELEAFASSASHDLRAPIVTIRGFLVHMRDDLAAGRVDRPAEDIARMELASERMLRLLDDLLALSRAGRVTDALREVEIEQLARESLEALAGRVEARGAIVEIAAGQHRVLGNRTRLGQVLQNIIENGLRYVADDVRPRLRLECRRADREVVCQVQDNGIGIEEHELERIFTLFYRRDKSGTGTGLGLALTKRIVEAHGGRVWAESEGLGKGATLFFALPDAGTVNASQAGHAQH